MSAWRAFLYAFTLDRCADMLWTTTLVWLASGADSPSSQGIVVAAAFMPQMLLTMHGGALADRFGSARVATVTTVVKAALLCVVLAATSVDLSPLALIALIAALVGGVDGFHDPAMDSWGARLNRPEDQTKAAAKEAILWRGAQLAGTALGGLLLGAGAVLALSITVVLYAAERVLLGAMKANGATDHASPAAAGESAKQRIGAAFAFMREHPVLWATMGVQCVVTITIGGVMMVLTPNLVRDEGWPPVVYGVAVSVFTAGMMVGVALADKHAKARGDGAVGTVPFAAFGAGAAGHAVLWVLVIGGATLGPVGLCAVLFVYGSLSGIVGPLLTGYRRSITPKAKQGALAALARLVTISPELFGPLAAGFIVSAAGQAVGFWAFGAAGVCAAAVGAGAAWRAERTDALTT